MLTDGGGGRGRGGNHVSDGFVSTRLLQATYAHTYTHTHTHTYTHKGVTNKKLAVFFLKALSSFDRIFGGVLA